MSQFIKTVKVAMTSKVTKVTRIAQVSLAFLVLLSSVATAEEHNSVTRLKETLANINNDLPVGGVLTASFSNIKGEGKKKEETAGEVSLTIRHDKSGLTTSYPQSVVDAIELESLKNTENEDTPTPTLDAINDVRMLTVNQMLSPANALLRLLTFAKLQKVVASSNGEDLHFSLPVESFINDKKTRGYVDKFSGELVISVDNNGVPLRSISKFDGNGRAYVFFSMEATITREQQFKMVGKRLVTTLFDSYSRYESTFGEGEDRQIKTFKPKVLGLRDDNHFAKISKDTSI